MPSPIAASTSVSAEDAAQSALNSAAHAVREPHAEVARPRSACAICSTVSSASSRGSGKRSTSCHSSTDAPSTSPISRTSSGTRSSLGSTTANSSTATCSLRSSTSMPTMSAPSAPMRDATSPERARTVGKPDPHDESGAVGLERIVACCHAAQRTTTFVLVTRRSSNRQEAVHARLRRLGGWLVARTTRDPRRHVRSRSRRPSGRGAAKPASNSSSTACSWSWPATRGRSTGGSSRRPRLGSRWCAAAIEGVAGLEASRDRARPGRPDLHDRHGRAARGRRLVSSSSIVGADVARRLDSWHRADESARRGHHRGRRAPGRRCRPCPIAGLEHVDAVTMPRLDISSTDLRAASPRTCPIDFLVPPGAVRVIRDRRLYTPRLTLSGQENFARRATTEDATREQVTDATESTHRRRRGRTTRRATTSSSSMSAPSWASSRTSSSRARRTPVRCARSSTRSRSRCASAPTTSPASVEGLTDASWVLLDYGDFVVHVFLTETREFYGLERLWADAPRIAWEGVNASPL